jgi:hypothetical protein
VSVVREWWRRFAVAAAVPLAVGATAAVLVARGPAPGRNPAPTPTATEGGTPAPKPVPYELYTRCGIDYAQVGNRYYEAAQPLSNGSGTLTAISPARAVFTDKAGHRVVFTLVPSGPARTTARVCP